jgi:hypothetical protein
MVAKKESPEKKQGRKQTGVTESKNREKNSKLGFILNSIKCS